MEKSTFRRMTAMLAALLLTAAAQAQNSGRPIRIVLGFPAGGGSDTVLRVIAQRLSQQLGQTVIIDNKPGGEGIIAADSVAKAPADGTTLYFGSSSALIAVPILRDGKGIPYDPFKDFTPIANMGRFSMFMVSSPAVPAKTISEFIQYTRTRPGALNYASANSVTRLAALQMLTQNRLDMTHIPYKGDAAAITDVISGRVHMMFSTGAAVQGFVKDGRLQALVTLRETRSPQLPNVPTAKEAGLRISVSPWSGIYGPAHMPAATVERINQALRTALGTKDARDQLEQLGFEPTVSSPAEMAAIHRDEYEVFRKAVQEDGIKFE